MTLINRLENCSKDMEYFLEGVNDFFCEVSYQASLGHFLARREVLWKKRVLNNQISEGEYLSLSENDRKRVSEELDSFGRVSYNASLAFYDPLRLFPLYDSNVQRLNLDNIDSKD